MSTRTWEVEDDAPRRARRGADRALRKQRRERAPKAVATESEDDAGIVPILLRVLYGVAAALVGLWLYTLCNKDFGTIHRGWFWEMFRGADGGLALSWNGPRLQVLLVLLLMLSLLTAALLPHGRARALWVLPWVGLIVAVFDPPREDLRYYILWVLIGLGAGSVLSLARRGARPGTLHAIVWIVLLAELLMPLPYDESVAGRETAEASAYRSLAHEIVRVHLQEGGPAPIHLPESGEMPSRLTRHLDYIAAAHPGHILLLTFLLLTLACVGLRGPMMGTIQAVFLVLCIGGSCWFIYQHAIDNPGMDTRDITADWAVGLTGVGKSLQARFLAVLPALAAALGDLGLRPRRS